MFPIAISNYQRLVYKVNASVTQHVDHDRVSVVAPEARLCVWDQTRTCKNTDQCRSVALFGHIRETPKGSHHNMYLYIVIKVPNKDKQTLPTCYR